MAPGESMSRPLPPGLSTACARRWPGLAPRRAGGAMTQTPETRTRAPIGRRLVLAALLLLALAAAGGLAWLSLRPLPVRTGQVERGEAVEAVYASGVVEYVRQARVAPVVSAPILRVLAEEGQAVAAGQVLAQLDDGPQMGTTLHLEAQAAQA
ncbi:MAG: biotin/lipoyl-binding protein, partial [Phenylobacterium sp.]|nr:biotin/lipoyl-binding protein [Phenylobacterium sp.]